MLTELELKSRIKELEEFENTTRIPIYKEALINYKKELQELNINVTSIKYEKDNMIIEYKIIEMIPFRQSEKTCEIRADRVQVLNDRINIVDWNTLNESEKEIAFFSDKPLYKRIKIQ